VFALISYALPQLTGRKIFDNKIGNYAFWLANIGMIGMTAAFAVAGIAQVYLERKMGMDFMEVQKEIEVHFFVLILAATMFTVGIGLFVWNFLKFGQPTDEALENN
ncbi:MAG: cbb3-type cytochrome c oxidase subunit I, partial [Cyclobacteriaceae bacterium]|nr:cbb3-type cytochrome c oxidase subunit I [Cyclobacteriaceae bacterium]